MKTKSVIVVSHSGDASAKLLIQRLNEIGQPHHLVDLGSYPNHATATIDYSNNLLSCSFDQENVHLTPDSVKSIWWRRPKGKIRPPTVDPVRKYIELESEIFINSLFGFFKNSLWVSEPEKTRLGNYKPWQLQLARDLGFRIPKTIISNNPNAVMSFLDENQDMPMIMKPVGTSFVKISDGEDGQEKQSLAIYTKLIDKNQIRENIDMIANCPVMFQEAAEQEFDIRITVIGHVVFSAKVGHTNDSNAGPRNVDWRHQDLKRTFEPFILPPEVEQLCVKLVSALGLKFGAIDMGYSKKNGYVFFEINPQGQWVPTETVAGYPVSLTLAKLLTEC
jgi:glutathione synthase/RimK-type ligase-like ATP-grasp enzyme